MSYLLLNQSGRLLIASGNEPDPAQNDAPGFSIDENGRIIGPDGQALTTEDGQALTTE